MRPEKSVTGDEDWLKKLLKIRNGKLCSIKIWLKSRMNHMKTRIQIQQAVEKYYVIQQAGRKCYYDGHFLQIMKISLLIFCGKEFSGKTKTFF